MSDQSYMLIINGIDIKIVRKDIKNLHLGVYPPNGHVRVAVPKHITDDNVRLAVVSKIRWIKKRQKEFHDQLRQSERQFISGETHYFMGKQYRFELIERLGKHEVEFSRSGKLKMYIKPDTSTAIKNKLLENYYRNTLKELIPDLINKWEPLIGKSVSAWGVRKMKTKWGSCNIDKQHIWLNLELAKKPHDCLEYILVHEMIHLHERNHNQRFKEYMDTLLPNWEISRKHLNTAPLAHENWIY